MKVIAAFTLILVAPLWVFISALILITSGLPVIFKQERVGKDKKKFIIYKLRTMTNGKVTLIGKVIRKLGLDEIPQLLNIVKGEMAFVGPRPLTAFDIERLGWDVPEYADRWTVKPGITGMAQLTNICDASVSMSNDLAYVRDKSISLDLKVLFRSVLVPITGKRTA